MDLIDPAAVDVFFAAERPEVVVLAAAKVGGILANATFPADFVYEDTMSEANVGHAAHRHNVHKLLNLGSSCIYPKHAPQPVYHRLDMIAVKPLPLGRQPLGRGSQQ